MKRQHAVLGECLRSHEAGLQVAVLVRHLSSRRRLELKKAKIISFVNTSSLFFSGIMDSAIDLSDASKALDLANIRFQLM